MAKEKTVGQVCQGFVSLYALLQLIYRKVDVPTVLLPLNYHVLLQTMIMTL